MPGIVSRTLSGKMNSLSYESGQRPRSFLWRRAYLYGTPPIAVAQTVFIWAMPAFIRPDGTHWQWDVWNIMQFPVIAVLTPYIGNPQGPVGYFAVFAALLVNGSLWAILAIGCLNLAAVVVRSLRRRLT
jgi:hypothetical protein